MKQSQTSQWKAPAIAFAVFAVIAVAVFAFVSGSQTLGSEHLAEAACEDFVKEKLTSPSSAEFSNAETTETGEGEWTVTGAVDADNAFSASLRGRYSCDVWTTDGDTYQGSVTLLD